MDFNKNQINNRVDYVKIDDNNTNVQGVKPSALLLWVLRLLSIIQIFVIRQSLV